MSEISWKSGAKSSSARVALKSAPVLVMRVMKLSITKFASASVAHVGAGVGEVVTVAVTVAVVVETEVTVEAG